MHRAQDEPAHHHLGVGQRDVTLAVGGVDIEPGDYIYADNNGVLVSKIPLN